MLSSLVGENAGENFANSRNLFESAGSALPEGNILGGVFDSGSMTSTEEKKKDVEEEIPQVIEYS